jgi:hypothetical protein
MAGGDSTMASIHVYCSHGRCDCRGAIVMAIRHELVKQFTATKTVLVVSRLQARNVYTS